MPDRGHPWIALSIAVAAISTAAVLVRLAPGVEPIAAALWRTLTVGLILAPGILRFQKTGGQIQRRDLILTATAGLILGLHFWVWFESINRTTVLRSTLLVCLTPIWAGLMEWLWLRSPPRPRFWMGISITLIGVGLMTGDGQGQSSWSGDLLAVLGGILAAAYLLVGRVVRARVDIDAYGGILCLSCAAWLIIPAIVLKVPLSGFSTTEWWVLGGLALGPQLLGHMGLNYAVRYLSAAVVTSVVLLEPVGAALLGAIVPSINEIPSMAAMVGGLVAIAGVGVVSINPGPKSTPTSDPLNHPPIDEP